jgi:hypothetical protein
MFRPCVVLLFLFVAIPHADAQSIEAGVHLAMSQWSEFDGTDLGIGGRFTWKPSALIGIDADLAWYPAEFPPDAISFSDGRFEGLFGVTAGPRLGRVRPFGKLAAGFLRTAGTQERIICIAIFPPPLNCLMAADQTMPAIEFGGGVEIDATDRTFVRVDAGARMLQYPGPAIVDRDVRDEDFWGTGLRFTIGAGFRFNR